MFMDEILKVSDAVGLSPYNRPDDKRKFAIDRL
jgi:hypothetical protein